MVAISLEEVASSEAVSKEVSKQALPQPAPIKTVMWTKIFVVAVSSPRTVSADLRRFAPGHAATLRLQGTWCRLPLADKLPENHCWVWAGQGFRDGGKMDLLLNPQRLASHLCSTLKCGQRRTRMQGVDVSRRSVVSRLAWEVS